MSSVSRLKTKSHLDEVNDWKDRTQYCHRKIIYVRCLPLYTVVTIPFNFQYQVMCEQYKT